MQAYKTKLQTDSLAPSTINQRLSAIRKLAREATVPMPSWIKATIDEWTREASITQGRIFLRIHKGGYANGDRVSAQAVADVVREYARQCGFGSLAKTSTS